MIFDKYTKNSQWEKMLFSTNGDEETKLCSCVLSHNHDSCNPMYCSPLGSSVHGSFSGKNTEVSCHFLLQRIFLTQGLKLCFLCLLHQRQILYPLSQWGSWKNKYMQKKNSNQNLIPYKN